MDVGKERKLFRRIREVFAGNASSRCRPKQAYSGLQGFFGTHGTPQKLWRTQKHQSVSMVMVGELNWPS